MSADLRYLGKPRPLLDGPEKLAGRARYVGDVELPRMLHGRPVLSPMAAARIVSIDAEAAKAVPGVVAVLTERDLPSAGRPMTSRPSAVLARDRVVFTGQPVAVVVAETEEAAADGAQQVIVEYDPVTPVLDTAAAMAADAPLVWPDGMDQSEGGDEVAHAAVETEDEGDEKPLSNVHTHMHVHRGDVEAGLREASAVVHRTYRTPYVHQGYLETNGAVADWDPVRREMTIYASTQDQFQVRSEVARATGLSPQRVRVVQSTVGGGFGAKYGIVDPLAAAVAMAVGRAVKIVLTRTEDFLTSTPSPGIDIDLELGITAEAVTGLRARVIVDSGAFPAGLGGIVAVLLGGYYRCENVDIEASEVLTNKQPGGAYRAPGAPSTSFAIEQAVDEAVRQLGLDPMEFRIANVAGPGDAMGTGAPWPDLGLKPTLERLRAHPAWTGRSTGEGEGVGIAIGCWPGAASPASAICRADVDGSIQLLLGNADISGVNGSLVLVAAEVLQMPPDRIELVTGDTRDGVYAGPAGGSQTTYSVSTAVRKAAEEVRRQLLQLAGERLEVAAEDLELQDGEVQVKGAPTRKVSIAELASVSQSQAGGPGPIMGNGRAAMEVNAPGVAAHLVKVRVDSETGSVVPLQYVAVQDVGFALNPLLVEGQIHGGSGQGMGWGLYEGMQHDQDGQLVTATFLDYGLPTIDSFPDIEAIMVENPSPHGLNGARIVGEPPIVPGAAALANAVYDAVGVRITDLPITPLSMWEQMADD
jgi:CO/xanthine dehydrogenase Mo-binding subunit